MAANLLDFATLAELTTNAAPAWNAALVQLKASGADRSLDIPAGNHVFAEPPDEVTFAPLIRGQGLAVTRLVRGYPCSVSMRFIKWIGGEEIYGGAGGIIKDLCIDGGAAHGGVGFWAQAPAEQPGLLKGPHQISVENVHVICGYSYPNAGYWAYGFHFDGSLNANPPPGVGYGLRNVKLFKTSASQFSNWPYVFEHAPAARIIEAEAWAGYNVPSERYGILAVSCPGIWNYSPTPVVFG